MTSRHPNRDAAIVAYFNAGHKVRQCAKKFDLSNQRVSQILHAAGVSGIPAKTTRTKYLGVNVTEQTKAALEHQAKEQDKSVSKLASDVLDKAVAG